MAFKEMNFTVGEKALHCALCWSDCIWTIMLISNLFFNIRKLGAAQISKPIFGRIIKTMCACVWCLLALKCLFVV